MARYEVSGISVSQQGAETAEMLYAVLESRAKDSDLSVKWYHWPEGFESVGIHFISLDESLTEWIAKRIKDSSVLIFVGNISRVFMLTAPYISELTDNMTILVIDEFGKFCVPLLLGRRNEGIKFSAIFEKELGIKAVNMLSAKKGYDFSIERFAKENNMTISNTDYATEIMTSLTAGETVGLYTNYRFTGALPLGMEFSNSGEKGIYISPSFHNAFFNRTLWLIPRCMIVDLECPPDTLSYSLLNSIDTAFRKLNLYQEAIEKIRVPKRLVNDSLLVTFCRDRDIILEAPDSERKGTRKGYQAICDMETDDGIRCRVEMKNIVLTFLG